MATDLGFAGALLGIMSQARAAARQRELDAQAAEDRRLEREGLQLRLKAMKLDERLRAHQFRTEGAEAQFAALQGADPMRLQPEQLEGGVLPARAGVAAFGAAGASPAGGLERTVTLPRIAPVQFPGFEDPENPDFNRPGYARHPQGMQEILNARAAEARRRALEESFNLSDGAARFGPGATPGTLEVIASRPAADRPDTRSLQQQAADALRDGDRETYAQLVRVIRETGEAGRAPARADEDPRYARDRQEYADYVAAHNKQQEGRTVLASDPATGRERPVPAPYQPPLTFQEWRGLRNAPSGQARVESLRRPAGRSTPAAASASARPSGTSTAGPAARTRAQAVLRQFTAERDPTRKEALRRQLLALRAQIAGGE